MFHIVVIVVVVFLFYSSTKKECLVISTSNPLIDNVKDGFSLHEGSSGNGSKSKHGHSSVVHLSLLGKSELHSRHNSVRLGALGLLVHVSLKRIKQKRIRERQGADGGHKSNHEGMHIGKDAHRSRGPNCCQGIGSGGPDGAEAEGQCATWEPPNPGDCPRLMKSI